MKRFIILHIIITVIILFLPSNSYCYTDVTKLSYDGFKLGLSFEESIKILKKNGYVENKDKDVDRLAEGEYVYKPCEEKAFPCSELYAKGKDNSEYTILFANGELILFVKDIHHDKEYDRNVLAQKYYDLFGNPDTYLESDQKTYLIWGGKVGINEYPYDPKFTAIKVELSDFNEDHENDEISESVRIVSFQKVMGLQFSESLEQYVEGCRRYETELKKNLKLACEHMPKLKSLIEKDVRFKQIQMDSFEGGAGGIQIYGTVRKGDLNTLKKIVDSTSPPVSISWVVDEYPADIFDQVFNSSKKPE